MNTIRSQTGMFMPNQGRSQSTTAASAASSKMVLLILYKVYALFLLGILIAAYYPTSLFSKLKLHQFRDYCRPSVNVVLLNYLSHFSHSITLFVKSFFYSLDGASFYPLIFLLRLAYESDTGDINAGDYGCGNNPGHTGSHSEG